MCAPTDRPGCTVDPSIPVAGQRAVEVPDNEIERLRASLEEIGLRREVQLEGEVEKGGWDQVTSGEDCTVNRKKQQLTSQNSSFSCLALAVTIQLASKVGTGRPRSPCFI